jgi:RNA polymerase sigma-70 factor (ECF subfamily)
MLRRLADLASAFCAAALPHVVWDDALPRLEAELRARLDEARATWPSVEVEGERFAARLGECAGGDAAVDRLHTSDLFLACACLDSHEAALTAFDVAFLEPLGEKLRRYNSSPAFADEVRQILRERFFVWTGGAPPRIADYRGQGPLGAWVRVAAVRVALRLTRRPADARAMTLDAAIGPDPELEYLRARYRGPFTAALVDALATLGHEERNLLRLHYVDGLTIDGLAPLFRVHRATAARRLADARTRLLEATHARLEETLGVSGRELNSLIAVLRSRIEVDVRELFSTKQS